MSLQAVPQDQPVRCYCLFLGSKVMKLHCWCSQVLVFPSRLLSFHVLRLRFHSIYCSLLKIYNMQNICLFFETLEVSWLCSVFRLELSVVLAFHFVNLPQVKCLNRLTQQQDQPGWTVSLTLVSLKWLKTIFMFEGATCHK